VVPTAASKVTYSYVGAQPFDHEATSRCDPPPAAARRRLSPRISLVVFALVAAACTGGGGTTSSSTTTPPQDAVSGDDQIQDGEILAAPEWEPTTRAEQLLFEIDDETGPTPQDAIDALGLAVEGVPGVTPTGLPPGEDLGLTSTLWLVESFYDQLTPEQQAFVDELLTPGELAGTVSDDGTVTLAAGPETDGFGILAGPATTEQEYANLLWETDGRSQAQPLGLAADDGVPLAVAAATEAEKKKYTGLLAEVRKDLKAHIPDLPTHKDVKLYFTTKNLSGMDARQNPDDPNLCDIRIHPGFTNGNPTDDTIRFYFAHELFHCSQDLWGAEESAAKWVIEGSADWAAIDLYRSRALDYDELQVWWFTFPQIPLKVHAYSAWPLYENARLSNKDVYGAIKDMLFDNQKGVAAQLAVGGLDGQFFRKDWSSRTLRSTSIGPPWQLPWPTPNSGAGPHDNRVSLGERDLGTYAIQGSGYFTQLQLVVTMTSRVGLVTATPKGGPLTTHTAQGTVTVGDAKTGKFCFSPDGCRCPEDYTSDAIPMIGRDMLFSYAAAADATRTKVVATEWDPDKECRPDPPPKDGYSNGDPHLVTFDGLPYDVMTLGEFVTARDPAGDFEVQTRHEAFQSGAGTTAVALGTGGGRVTVTLPGFSALPEPVVRVDGTVTTDPELDVGGVRISVADGEISAVWPDGSTVEMQWFRGWFVSVELSPQRAGRMEGLLGNADGDLVNDLRFPDGMTVDTSDAEPHESAFVLAWAVDDATTLFDYEPGQSVATFRIPHPNPEPPPPDPEATEVCELALGDDAAAHEVDSCAFDVTVTGDGDFVDAYQVVVAERVTGTNLPVIAAPVTTTTTGPGAAGVAGEPTLVLDVDRPTGVVTAVEGTVLLLSDDACGDDDVSATVTRVGAEDELAVAALCDPSGLAGLLAGADDEWINGEAYVWLPGSGDYEVSISSLDIGPFGTVSVYVDPTPTVLRPDQLGGGDQRVLSGLADTVVYLTEPGAAYAAEGFDVACAIEVYWLAEFPDSEPWDLDFCNHSAGIDFPPTDMVIPVVVFNRSGGDVAIRLTPAG
jgi:hypothetical protein